MISKIGSVDRVRNRVVALLASIALVAGATIAGSSIALPAAANVACGSACNSISSTPSVLAHQLLNDLNFSAEQSGILDYELAPIAAGTPIPGCQVDVRILQILVIVTKHYGSMRISDLNRACPAFTHSYTCASNPSSVHCVDPSLAIDIVKVGGNSVDGSNAKTHDLLDFLDAFVPSGTSAGQSTCRSGWSFARITQFSDTCSHQHIDLRGISGGLDISALAPTGTSDYTIYRATGTWYSKGGPDGTPNIPADGFGISHGGWSGDVPLVGDFDHDGRDDYAIYRSTSGTWYVKSGATGAYLSNIGGSSGIVHGGHSGDIPLVGDVNGDGYADLIIYRSELGVGTWYAVSGATGGYLANIGGAFGVVNGGLATDVPLVGDLNGDGFDDLTIYRSDAGVGTWYALSGACGCWDANIANAGYGVVHGGWAQDVPLLGDIDGDRKDDFVLFRSVSGTATWYGKSGPSASASIPSSGLGVIHGGWAGDIPLLGKFN